MNLTEKQLQELENIVLDFPTRYGLPILQFFTKAKADNEAAAAEAAQQKKADPVLVYDREEK